MRGGGSYVEPYVAYVDGDNSVHYNKSSDGGDTPKNTPWKILRSAVSSYYYTGIANKPGNIVIYGGGSNNESARFFDADGKVLGGNAYLTDSEKSNIISQLQNYCTVQEIEMIATPYAVLEYVPGFGDFLELQTL